MERRMNGGWGRRGTKGKRNNERDAYVSFLIVTGSTLRYRPREARPCHYYPIISCITVTVNEVSYYAARRGGGWKKRGERRPYVSWGEKGKRARRGSMSLRWKKKKKKKDIRHLQFTPFIIDANLDLDWEKIRWSSWIYYIPISTASWSAICPDLSVPKFQSRKRLFVPDPGCQNRINANKMFVVESLLLSQVIELYCSVERSQKWHVYIENDE